MTILFMTGLARSGKSSVIEQLSNLGIVSLSTSHYLSKQTVKHYKLSPESFWVEVLKDKEDGIFKRATGTTCREAKIHVAENVIVPKLGRLEGLVKPTISTYPYFDHAICEVFNLEELECWKQGFDELGYNVEDFDYIALRSVRELQGVDGRELYGDDIYNDGLIEDTVKLLMDRITNR